MPKRKVDIFAGAGSLADRLRKRRDSIESGDETGGANDTSVVVQRGYMDETDDDSYGRDKPLRKAKGWN